MNYGVIFDMDGVLVDSYQAHFESWGAMGRERGLEMTEEQFASTFGRTSHDIIRGMWGQAIPDSEVDAFDARKEALYREIAERNFPEMDGASDLLAALHAAGFGIAIGSSGPPENVALILKCLRNANFINATADRSMIKAGKPAPDVFLVAAGKLGLAPARCAVVEDAPAGVQAALAAGMKAIAITGTAPREKLAKAHVIIESLRELTPERIAELIDGR